MSHVATFCNLLTKRFFFGLGTLFRASQFLSEELPIRLAHRVQELGDLPDGLNEMPSIKKVQDWYAQSFEVDPNPTIDRNCWKGSNM